MKDLETRLRPHSTGSTSPERGEGGTVSSFDTSCWSGQVESSCWAPGWDGWKGAERSLAVVDDGMLRVGRVEARVVEEDERASGVRVVDLAWVERQNGLMLARSDGVLLLVTVAGSSSFAGGGGVAEEEEPLLIEEVGHIESGIYALSWSPAEEVGVVVTGNNTVLAFSADELEPLAEVGIAEEDGEEGWTLNRARTAWRGDGKCFITLVSYDGNGSTETGTVEARVWSLDNNGSPVMESVADGVDARTSGDSVAWQPSGAVWATVERGEERAPLKVVLRERNGLKRSEFELPEGDRAVSHLSWNSSSDILGIVTSSHDGAFALQLWTRRNYHWYLKKQISCSEEGATSDTQQHSSPPSIQWDLEKPLELTLIGGRDSLPWLSDITMNWVTRVTNAGTVAVTDGRRLLITPLGKGVLPPPMCAVCAITNAAIDCVAVRSSTNNESDEEERIAILTVDGKLGVVSNGPRGWLCRGEGGVEDMASKSLSPGMPKTPAIRGCFVPHLVPLESLAGRTASSLVRGLAWADENTLAMATTTSEGRTKLIWFRVEKQSEDAYDGLTSICENFLPTDWDLCSLSSNPLRFKADAFALAQLDGGGLYRCFCRASECSEFVHFDELQSFPERCPSLNLIPASLNAEVRAMGLTGDGRLYCGSRLILSACTSFALHVSAGKKWWVVVTTRQNVLRVFALDSLDSVVKEPAVSLPSREKDIEEFVPEKGRGVLQQQVSAAMRGAGMTSVLAGDTSARAVEIGAEVVSCPDGGELLVLQMPRGNLEAIYPRALILDTVCTAMRDNDFKVAARLSHGHRLDLNLFVDYTWPDILVPSYATHVVRSVQPYFLSELINSLSHTSVISKDGLYPLISPNPSADKGEIPKEFVLTDKQTSVCLSLRQAMLSVDAKSYLEPILLSFINTKEADFGGALLFVKGLRDEDLKSNAQADVGETRALVALRSLTNMVPDKRVLCDAALGTYDLELTAFVYSLCDQDPGEFLPNLEELESMPELKRRTTIDIRLRRYQAALRNMVQSVQEGTEDPKAIVQLAKSQMLYREAIALSQDPALLQPLYCAYGEHLNSRGRYEDGAMAFLSAGNLREAHDSYRAAGEWRMAMSLAARVGLTGNELRKTARTMATELEETGQHVAAASLHREYLKNTDGAVENLVSANHWREAFRVSQLEGREDLVETTIAPAAAVAATSILEHSREDRERAKKYIGRLRELRRKKEEFAAMLAAADDEFVDNAGMLEDDGMSEGASQLSAYTTSSTIAGGSSTAPSTASHASARKAYKKKKKAKKNKGKLRAGTPGEELALRQHIASLSPSCDTLKGIGELCEFLVLLGHLDDARKVQAEVALLLDEHKAAMEEIAAMPAMTDQDKPAGGGSSSPLSPSSSSQPTSYQVEAWKWTILR